MDEETVSAYDRAPAQFARDWREQPVPTDLYALLRAYFKSGPTLDVGCGAGRDVAWLAAHGYDASGVDASAGLLREAAASYPALHFARAQLPALEGLCAGAYENVLCETVVMHLEAAAIGPSVRRMLELLRPAGTLFLSWRVTDDTSTRDGHGRLYAAFDKRLVTDALAGQTLLLDQEDFNRSSGKKVHRVVVHKTAA
jgi:2-polyprenyl-3-methyl-5-hydroxy-6-metoxy-1,4-benzoquinol methylase